MQVKCLSQQFVRAIVLTTLLLPSQTISQAQAPSTITSQPSAHTSGANAGKPETGKVTCTSNGTYVNSKGQTIKRPEMCSGPPRGATAECRDGAYSFSQSRRGTCSRHGGVSKWF